jgi:hypothetical protein
VAERQFRILGEITLSAKKWSSLYALVNDGEGGYIVVVRPKDVAGFEPLQEDADIDTVLRLSYLEKAYADIKHHHGADHCTGNTLLARFGQSIHNIGRVCTKLFTRTCPICIQRETPPLSIANPMR